MDVEMEDVRESSQNFDADPLYLWFFRVKSEGKGCKKATINVPLEQTSLNKLKALAVEQSGIYSSLFDIDILHNGKVLKEENEDQCLSSLNIKPRSILNIIKRVDRVEAGSQAFIQKKSPEQLNQIAVALKTAFFNSNFIPTVNKLPDSEMLENILAASPGLSNDSVGLALILDSSLIFAISDIESLKKLNECRPWVLEALSMIAAAVHAEKGGRIGNANFNLGDIFNEMEEEEEGEEQAGASQSALRISREQLSSAIARAMNLQPNQAAPTPGSSTMAEFLANAARFQASQGQGGGSNLNRTGPHPPLSSMTGNSPGAHQPLNLNTSQNAPTGFDSSGQQGQRLTSDLVARALNEAIQGLPPDQQASQFDALRSLASQLLGSQPNNSAFARGIDPTPTSETTSGTSANEEGEFSVQLGQMRQMGITDMSLSIMALRLCDGDVNTAADLILSGWQGEGAGNTD